MKFKVKDLDISTGGILVVVLNAKDAAKLDLHAGDRIAVKTRLRKVVVAVDIAESSRAVRPGWIGCFEEILDKLRIKEGRIVNVFFERKPPAISYIRRKLDKKKLSSEQIDAIIGSIVHDELTEEELTYYVSACYTNGMSSDEVTALTKSIVKHGDKFKATNHLVLDKHCSGGVPGNRTTMLVVPIIAAAGFSIPKTSSRSITSPAGTADTMEVLAKVTLPVRKIKKIVKKTNGCIVWGGGMNLASADDKLIKVRHPMSIDPEGMLIASILAKKLAVGANHVLIDLPIGKHTKIKTKAEALRLKKIFKQVGRKLGMKIYVVITDGEDPIGNGIGPLLEAKDVLYVLRRDEKRPLDLEKKALFLASKMFEIAGVKNAAKKAKDILESGKAYEKMKQIIKAQGGKPNIDPESLKPGKFSYNAIAKRSGKIVDINTHSIARIARIAGAPMDKAAGMYLYKHEKQRVKKGELLFTLYAQNKEKLEFAKQLYKEIDGYKIR